MHSYNVLQSDASLAIALTEAELSAFFPDAARQELLDVFPETHVFTGNDPKAFASFLSEHRSQVLLSGWQTPALSHLSPGVICYVCHLTGSVRHIIPRPLIESGLRVTNWGDGAAETVAENVLMLILSALRQTQYWGREMHERAAWRSDYGGSRTLFDRTVAIHGFGRIARALLPMLAPFRTSVSVYSQGVPPEYIRAHGATPVATLDDLIKGGSDILIELEALTPETRGAVQEEHLRSLRSDAVFVNSGRGAVVNETALERIACEGKLQIALDVYATEPLPPLSPLRGLPNVTLMPHQGGPTQDRYPAIGRFAIENLRRWRNGESLEAEVTLERYDAST